MARGLVRYVYWHMAFIGQESVRAAEASECAAEQGAFWEYHDKVYESQTVQHNAGGYSDANLKRFAAEIDLDMAQFNACLDGGRYAERVQAQLEAAKGQGVRSTPTLVINGRMLEGLMDYSVYQRTIEDELARAQ